MLIVVLSCQSSHDKITASIAAADSAGATIRKFRGDAAQLEEYFIDSTNIGRKSLNKIELSKYGGNDSSYVTIRFFSKQNGKWEVKNEFHFQKDEITGCEPKLTDFNNDGLEDMTYVSGVAARGANEIRRLFIYDKNKDRLIFIKNSEDYPNILYNKELNCIDAFLMYGGCSTVFLTIKADSLVQFASVELMDGLTVRTFDKQGNETIILQDTTNKAENIRYKNFNPLKEYTSH